MMRKFQVTAIAIFLATTSVLGVVRAETIGLSTYTIAHGEIITTNIFADNIELPVGRTAHWAGDVILRASNSISINGVLAGAGMHSLTLWSNRHIAITGEVHGAHGADAADIVSNTSSRGGDGERGGNLTFKWGLLGSLTVGADAVIQGANGGRGGSVEIRVDEGSPLDILAEGGAGGAAGAITFNGTFANVYGAIVRGNGGHGGRAWIADAEGASLSDGGTWTGLGGAGGSAMVMEPCFGCSLGGDGGRGGAACAPVEPSVPRPPATNNCVDPPGLPASPRTITGLGPGGNCDRKTEMRGGQGGSGFNGEPGGDAFAKNPCNGQPGLSGAHGHILNCNGANGQHGGKGGAASAYGGRGGSGVNAGGRGGSATAIAGNGGAGGNGGNAWNVPGCYGGHGGNGGGGGAKTAIAGNGGNAFCTPGEGGIAEATDGQGGRAGSGGYPGGMPGNAGASGDQDARNGVPGSHVGDWCGP